MQNRPEMGKDLGRGWSGGIESVIESQKKFSASGQTISERPSQSGRRLTFSMSRWSCWDTCQQGSPRTAVMLRRSAPVRQETLLLANVSFI